MARDDGLRSIENIVENVRGHLKRRGFTDVDVDTLKTSFEPDSAHGSFKFPRGIHTELEREEAIKIRDSIKAMTPKGAVVDQNLKDDIAKTINNGLKINGVHGVEDIVKPSGFIVAGAYDLINKPVEFASKGLGHKVATVGAGLGATYVGVKMVGEARKERDAAVEAGNQVDWKTKVKGTAGYALAIGAAAETVLVATSHKGEDKNMIDTLLTGIFNKHHAPHIAI